MPVATKKRPRVKGTPNGCAAYLRVSSASQTLKTQRHAIETASSARGDVVGTWYADRFTGGGAWPPALVRLLADVRAGAVRCLYVYAIDRLGRRGIRDTLTVIEQLREARCRLVSLADPLGDSEGPMVEIHIAWIAWAAQRERTIIADRIRAARERIEAAGGRWGRPSRVTRKLAGELAAEHAAGRSVRELAVAYKLPRSTVHAALQRRYDETLSKLAAGVSGKGTPGPGVKKAVNGRA